MMFAAGCIYRHQNCLDLDLHVLKVQYRGPKYWKLKVAWIFRDGSLCQLDRVTVKKEDFVRWRRVGVV